MIILSVARSLASDSSAVAMGVKLTHRTEGESLMICAYEEVKSVGMKGLTECLECIRRYDRIPEKIRSNFFGTSAEPYYLSGDEEISDLLHNRHLNPPSTTIFGTDIGPRPEIALAYPSSVEPDKVKSFQSRGLQYLADGKIIILGNSEAVTLSLRQAIEPDAQGSALSQAVALLVAGVEAIDLSAVEF